MSDACTVLSVLPPTSLTDLNLDFCPTNSVGCALSLLQEGQSLGVVVFCQWFYCTKEMSINFRKVVGQSLDWQMPCGVCACLCRLYAHGVVGRKG